MQISLESAAILTTEATDDSLSTVATEATSYLLLSDGDREWNGRWDGRKGQPTARPSAPHAPSWRSVAGCRGRSAPSAWTRLAADERDAVSRTRKPGTLPRNFGVRQSFLSIDTPRNTPTGTRSQRAKASLCRDLDSCVPTPRASSAPRAELPEQPALEAPQLALDQERSR